MDLKYSITPAFVINFLKIECGNFKKKKQLILKELKKYPEKLNKDKTFYSNRGNTKNLHKKFIEIFSDEFNLMSEKFKAQICLQDVWSVSYKKNQYHVPHNHGSVGHAGIIYLNYNFDLPKTLYMQPWNNPNDKTYLCEPPVKEGDIMIVPQSIVHFTKPNLTSFKKRIISFDFHLKTKLS
tara:strand:+ start:189 stop:731 length:543 start_codon:yes stop_codon:yes gene_type:complete